MVGKPNFSPRRGWNYRLVLVDNKGNTVHDDVKFLGKHTHKVLDRLIAEIFAIQGQISNPKEWSFQHTHYYCDEEEFPLPWEEEMRLD